MQQKVPSKKPFNIDRTAIFDLDGTLVDMKKSTMKACFYALTKVYGYDIPKVLSKHKIRETLGRPFAKVLAECGISVDIIAKLDEHDTIAKKEFAY